MYCGFLLLLQLSSHCALELRRSSSHQGGVREELQPNQAHQAPAPAQQAPAPAHHQADQARPTESSSQSTDVVVIRPASLAEAFNLSLGSAGEGLIARSDGGEDDGFDEEEKAEEKAEDAPEPAYIPVVPSDSQSRNGKRPRGLTEKGHAMAEERAGRGRGRAGRGRADRGRGRGRGR